MSNVYQITSQYGLNASNGLRSEIVATCEPLGNFRISLMEHSGEVFLSEALFFQNLTQSLCDAKRQVKLSFLFGWDSRKAITEKFILYHNDYISKVALSISVIIFFSMVMTPLFCAKIEKDIEVDSLLSEYLE